MDLLYKRKCNLFCILEDREYNLKSLLHYCILCGDKNSGSITIKSSSAAGEVAFHTYFILEEFESFNGDMFEQRSTIENMHGNNLDVNILRVKNERN